MSQNTSFKFFNTPNRLRSLWKIAWNRQITHALVAVGLLSPSVLHSAEQQAYAKASNTGIGDQFGHSVAISGDTAVVGACQEDSSSTGVNSMPSEGTPNSGAAYVFVRSGGTWIQQAYLKASNPKQNDSFGISVAISGDTIVVGAAGEDNVSTRNSGAAYIFVRNGTTWTQQAFLKAGNPGPQDEFGSSVAISGDTAVIGAIGEASSTTGVNSTPNDNATNAGAAYVFVRSGATWTQQAYLKAGSTSAQDRFGSGVGITGDTVLVGAPLEDSSSVGVNSVPNENSSNSGAAYIFIRTGNFWTQQAYLKASNTGVEDRFGASSVAITGDTIVVGAHQEDGGTAGVNMPSNESLSNSGAAYIFRRTGNDWTQQAYLKASNPGMEDAFGHVVTVHGDTVVIGAPLEDSAARGVNGGGTDENSLNSGAAYVFTRSGESWSQQAYLKASNTGDSDLFGLSVALSGDTAIVGASSEASGTSGVNSMPNEAASSSGAAYIFKGLGTPSAPTPANFVATLNEDAGTFDLRYDLVGPHNVPVSIQAFFSLTGAPPWLPLQTATGLGSGYRAGNGYLIRWNYFADQLLDVPELGTNVTLRITATGAGSASMTSFVTVSAPVRGPVKPIMVNFCFGHAAPFSQLPTPLIDDSYTDLSGVMLPATTPPGYDSGTWQQEVRNETEAIFRRAGITSRSMTFQIGPPGVPTPTQGVVNVFICPVLSFNLRLLGIMSYDGTLTNGPDRFNAKSLGEVAIFVDDGLQTPIYPLEDPGPEVRRHPVPLSATAAHEIGHTLGLFHVGDLGDADLDSGLLHQHSCQSSIMDYNHCFAGNLALRSDFSRIPLNIEPVTMVGTPVKHNERYHLLRWVEGLPSAVLSSLQPGLWDLPNVPTMTNSTTVAARFQVTTGQALFNVKVFYRNYASSLHLARDLPSLSAAELSDLRVDVPAGTEVFFIGSSIPDGPADTFIGPPSSVATGQPGFTPETTPALQVIRLNLGGPPTVVGTGSLSTTTIPRIPSSVALSNVGYNGENVRIEFDAVPGNHYTIERSYDLVTWQSVPAMTNTAATDTLQSVTDVGAAINNSRAFYKITALDP